MQLSLCLDWLGLSIIKRLHNSLPTCIFYSQRNPLSHLRLHTKMKCQYGDRVVIVIRVQCDTRAREQKHRILPHTQYWANNDIAAIKEERKSHFNLVYLRVVSSPYSFFSFTVIRSWRRDFQCKSLSEFNRVTGMTRGVAHARWHTLQVNWESISSRNCPPALLNRTI